MTPTMLAPVSPVARQLCASVIAEEIADRLMLADDYQQTRAMRFWSDLSAGAKAFYRERAVMAIRLCNLETVMPTVRHRVAAALERGCDHAAHDLLASLGDDPLSDDASALIDELTSRVMVAMLGELKGDPAPELPKPSALFGVAADLARLAGQRARFPLVPR